MVVNHTVLYILNGWKNGRKRLSPGLTDLALALKRLRWQRKRQWVVWSNRLSWIRPKYFKRIRDYTTVREGRYKEELFLGFSEKTIKQ